jgi:DNA-binding CsgD family transcriptional regulator
MKVSTLRRRGKLPAEVVVPTARERSLLRSVWCGRSVKEMANELNLTTNSVHTYMSRIMETLGLQSRAELQAWIAQHPDCLIPGQPVERRFHEADALPDTPDAGCPCLWCSALRLSGFPKP